MSKSNPLQSPRFVLALACIAELAACGGGGGGGPPAAIAESELNDSTATADALPVGTPVQGSVATAGDVDFFKVTLPQGSIVKIELFAARADQAGWDAAGNVPRLSVWDTDANGNAKLLEHDFGGNTSDGWSFGAHDLDIPMFEVPATGTYFVSVTQDDTSLAGGAYTLRVLYPVVTGKQEEIEPTGSDGGNDTTAT
ncbi:MAG TPA: DVUA0089 family protein, partial [Thermoanaerobaculia bacterium]|nr:DVUA0089 family protein [Thermoanaerobaculia bacterium]